MCRVGTKESSFYVVMFGARGVLSNVQICLFKLFQVMSNQDAVNCIRNVKDARSSAKRLTEEAVNRKSTDDISCIVVKFQ